MDRKHFFEDLIPPPRRITAGPKDSRPPRRLTMDVSIRDVAMAADFAHLSAIVLKPWVGVARGPSLCLRVELAGASPRSGSERVPASLAREFYTLEIGASVRLRASAYGGLAMGLQMLRQILENADQTGFLPHCRIADWPRLAMRGIHVDLAREMEYRPAHLRRVVENVAALRMNTLHLYLENKFAFPSAPDVAPPRVMTPAQARALCEYARLFGVAVIPQISTLGHMEHLLNGKHAELREKAEDSYNLCPTHPNSRPFLAGLIADVAEAFRSPFIHIGYDESHSGVCARCREHGTPQRLLADHLNWLNAEVKKQGARTMIYADKFLSREEFPRLDAANGGTPAEAHAALDGVSRDIVVTDWHYTSPYSGTVRYLVKEGFEVHMASATNMYWHDSIPLNRGHHWVVSTMDEAIAGGASGAFNTNWEYYRGQFLDNFWYFQGLAAERMWSASPHDYASWGARFARRFWGVETDYFSDIAGLVEAVNTARRRAFLDSDVLAIDVPSALNPQWPEWRQIVLDYRETGEYAIAQTRRFRAAARRNADTLRLLDMPGQIIRYLGVRAEQRVALDKALPRGDKAAAIRSLKSIRESALQVQARLDEGYRVYGGAVADRGRLAGHLQALAAYERIIRGTSVRALKAMNVDVLIQQRRVQDTDKNLAIRAFRASSLLPRVEVICRASHPSTTSTFAPIPFMDRVGLADVRPVHVGGGGLVYVEGKILLKRPGKGTLLYGSDGPVKVWVNGHECGCEPAASNPAKAGQYQGPAVWKKGMNRIVFALDTNDGKAWGVIASCRYGT